MNVDPVPVRRALVARPALARAVIEGDAGVTLIVAPAGYGKTLLLREAYETGQRSLWLTLSDEHEDAACLLEALEAAAGLARAEGGSEGGLLARMRALREHLVGSGRRIFLDQIERLADTPAALALGTFLGLAAPSIPFVLAGRSEAGLDLWDLHLRGWVRSLGGRDIRFADDDIGALMRAWTQADVEPALVRWLSGWPAGAALLSEESPAVITAIQRGDDVFPAAIARYLEHALLAPETRKTQTLLMQLAVLERIEPDVLCEVLHGSTHWKDIEILARQFAFLEPGFAGLAFTMQPLFCAFLRHRFERLDPVGADVFKVAVADRLWSSGRIGEAVQVARRIRNREKSARMLERMEAWRLGLSEGQATLSDVLDLKPIKGDFPALALARIYAAARRGDILAARAGLTHFGRVLEEMPGRVDASLLSFFAIMEVVTAVSEDRPMENSSFKMLEDVIKAAADDQLTAGSAACSLALIYIGEGRMGEAAAVCKAHLRQLNNLTSSQVPVFLHVQASLAALALGHMEQARASAEAMRQIEMADLTIGAYELAACRATRCALHYEMDELEATRRLLGEILE